MSASDSTPPAGRTHRGPHVARLLGFAGAGPFLLLAFYLLTHPEDGLASRAFTVYSAVILSFLGGIRWGAAGNQGDRQEPDLWISTLPAVVAWVALLLPSLDFQVALLLLGHLGAAIVDGLLPPKGQLAWLRSLRLQLSSLVLLCHGVLLTVLL